MVGVSRYTQSSYWHGTFEDGIKIYRISLISLLIQDKIKLIVKSK